MQSIILTPNRRLAAAKREQHQQAQIKQGALSWQTEVIMPLVSWLECLWLDYTQQQIETTPLLLTSYQGKVLWEDIIRHTPESEHLLQITRTAKTAVAAWGLLKQWNIPLNHPDLNSTDNSQQFLIWAKQFQKKCRQNNWLDAAAIPDYLQDKKLTAPLAITLVEFIDIPPQIKALLDHFQAQGTTISIEPLTNQHGLVTEQRPVQSSARQQAESRSESTAHSLELPRAEKLPQLNKYSSNQTKFHISLEDKEDEILTMARWAKATYEANSFNEIKIGCIIPDLDNSREQIKRVFHEVFKDYPELIFNISAGKPLTSYPIIFTALKLFSLAEDVVPIDIFNHILRTPFIGEAETESQQRALYDRYLQNQNLITFALADLSSCPRLKKRIEQIQQMQPSSKQSPSQWAMYFNEMLFQLGWPGERSLNSEEYQIIQNGWQPLLNHFATLDLIFESISLKNAVHYLSVLAEAMTFQPQSPAAPIQILGTLEAAGLSFDHLWMMGMDDRSWPPSPSPNPFIPHQLQKQLHMPNASAERELDYCQKLTAQFISHSRNIIFSHSCQNEEMTLRPTALIKDFPKLLSDQIQLAAYHDIAESIFASRQIEQLDDCIGPAVDTDKPFQGGTSIFKLQALCPFKAFSELRLQARFVDPPSSGLQAQDRGKILHKVLELCWLALKDSAQLHTLDLVELEKLISECIENTFTQSKSTQPKKNNRYLQIEKKRLTKILLSWFALEKKRPHFRTIACEAEREVSIGSINFKLRIDRIDQFENGEKIIIDYKTGKNNQVKAWFGDRPDEPQLPLYCVTEQEPISAIAFAELHPSLIGLKGISKQNSNILGIKSLAENKLSDASLWDEQVNLWRTVLTKLGNNFYQGIAVVDPKDPVETCRQCHLQSLCRIYDNHD